MNGRRAKVLRREALAVLEPLGGGLHKQGWRRLKSLWRPGADVRQLVLRLLQEDLEKHKKGQK